MRSAAGTVGLSYGVVVRTELVLVENFGYRDLEKQLPPNEGTILIICSMTNGLVSSVVDMLIEGELGFDDLVRDLLPTYNPST